MTVFAVLADSGIRERKIATSQSCLSGGWLDISNVDLHESRIHPITARFKLGHPSIGPLHSLEIKH